MAALTVTALTKRYPGGEAPAVDDLSFTLETGQFGVLLGPSGAGKTTTLSLIAGITPPDSGEVALDGDPLDGVPPEQRDIAMVFENYALYPHMSVRRNIAFPLRAPVRAGSMSRSQIDQRVQEVARTLRITELLDRLPSQLSGGQRQRVALGRALARRPRLLLLDEPITHLDAKLRHEMRTELKRIQRELGVTTLYATPDQADALALADLVIVLGQGRAWQLGPPDDLFRRPAHVRVAQSLGDPRMNLLAGLLIDDRVRVLGQDLPVAELPDLLPDTRPVTRYPAEVLAGIRPAHVEVLTTPQPAAMAGRVLLHHRLGHKDVLHVEVDGELVRAVTPAGEERQPGDPIWLRFPAKHVHLFDPGTGWALRAKARR